MEKDEIVTRELYRFEEKEDSNEKVDGELRKINDLKNLTKLMNAGLIRVYREGYV
jgi:pilus assembly protein CpaF